MTSRSTTVPVAGHVNTRTTCDIGQERFDCSASFGEKEYRIDCRRLTGGRAELAFGEMTLDLTRCAEIAEDCRLELKASFGEMKVLVPRTCRVHSDIRTSFAACAAKGEPGPDAGTTIYITGGVSFGELEIRYL